MKQEELKESGDGMVVDGVRLPSHVLQQFKEHGLDPTQYSAGVLHEVIAASADGTMIEDHKDGSLLGKLKLTADEKDKKNQEEPDGIEEEECEEHTRHSHSWRKVCGKKKSNTSHTERLVEERIKQPCDHHCAKTA